MPLVLRHTILEDLTVSSRQDRQLSGPLLTSHIAFRINKHDLRVSIALLKTQALVCYCPITKRMRIANMSTSSIPSSICQTGARSATHLGSVHLDAVAPRNPSHKPTNRKKVRYPHRAISWSKSWTSLEAYPRRYFAKLNSSLMVCPTRSC